MQRQFRARTESGVFIVIAVAIAVVLNLLALKVVTGLRYDLTKRGLYSLSVGTKRTLGRLHDQLSITVYWSADQPPPANDDERLIREQLAEYVAEGHGNVIVRFVRPDNDERKRDATNAQCVERPLQAVGANQAILQRVFRCMTFEYLRSRERIDFVPPGVEGMEYQVTSLIKKMLDPERAIGFLTGHEEGTPEAALPYLTQVMQREHINYTTRTVDLHGGDEAVPNDVKGLIIMNPTHAIPERELRQINAYLMRGGAVAIFAGGVNVTGDVSRPTAARNEHGLNALLEGYGVTINPDVIVDLRSTDAVVRVDDSPGRIRLLTFPVIAQDDLDQAHPAVFRLPMIVTPFVSSMTINRARATENGTTLTTIGRTTEMSLAQRETYELDVFTLFESAMRLRQSYFQRPGHGPHTVAVALEGQLRSAFPGNAPAADADGGAPAAPINAPAHAEAAHPARLLVVSSGKMFTMDELRVYAGIQQGMPTNISMLLDTFDWLSQDADLLAVRAKNVSEPELRGDVSDTKLKIFQWGSIVGLPLLIGVLGVVLATLRTRRRAAIRL